MDTPIFNQAVNVVHISINRLYDSVHAGFLSRSTSARRNAFEVSFPSDWAIEDTCSLLVAASSASRGVSEVRLSMFIRTSQLGGAQRYRSSKNG